MKRLFLFLAITLTLGASAFAQLPVNVTHIGGSPATAGGFSVGGNVAGGTTDAGNPVKFGSVFNTTPPSYTNGQRTDSQADAKGNLKTVLCDGNGNNRCAFVDANNNVQVITPSLTYNSTQPSLTNGQLSDFQITTRAELKTVACDAAGNARCANVDAAGNLSIAQFPNATGGWSTFNATAADGATACTSTAQAVKASAGTLGGYYFNNPNTADEWVHFYDVAQGSVTVGTTNPKASYRLPGAAANSVAANIEISMGLNFGTAISMACTSTAATNAAPANALEIDVYYK